MGSLKVGAGGVVSAQLEKIDKIYKPPGLPVCRSVLMRHINTPDLPMCRSELMKHHTLPYFTSVECVSVTAAPLL